MSNSFVKAGSTRSKVIVFFHAFHFNMPLQTDFLSRVHVNIQSPTFLLCCAPPVPAKDLRSQSWHQSCAFMFHVYMPFWESENMCNPEAGLDDLQLQPKLGGK